MLPITLTLAAACALLNMWLGVRCARIRISDRVMHGGLLLGCHQGLDEDDLHYIMRAFSDFADNAGVPAEAHAAALGIHCDSGSLA